MPNHIRVRKRQLARLTEQAETEWQKVPPLPPRCPVRRKKPLPVHFSSPAVGKRYRAAKSLHGVFTTPPPVGTVFAVGLITMGKVYLDTDGFRLDVTEAVLREFFSEEESE